MNKASALSNRIIQEAIKAGASDIHFSPQETKVDIYFRINGRRCFHYSITYEQYSFILTYYKFTAKMDIGEMRKPQQGTISTNFQSQAFSLRLSTLPANASESLAIRILPQDEIHTLDQISLFPNQYKTILQWLNHRSGIILFTGPTGSGKTTTLYAILQAFMDQTPFQTVTLEDPVEKRIDHILQVQVNEHAGMTYDAGLKAALRHDPDIIMVGEIRDQQTAKFAFRASNTGHLVLSTLHANNGPSTINRLLDMGIKSIDLHQSLIAIASVQLVTLNSPKSNQQRAAIFELLERETLQKVIQDPTPSNTPQYASFKCLRRKAYAYGFITTDQL
ncbi:competence type IV pilus ATPase ComGA [Gracilibacillus sp. YIM 98692]|uniref:competence type IV pilus ATPase ComGA n=1 Tax=Gracilibacillus sp. YIM 98692 TaxID=2663532 RepID=UPI0013D7772E|nr:competence type IV pilus ATPase ComGA [Gracilibacillus sp. YIM 98692]